MLQNLKVDIIYYKTNTDFEMEFNLCGCCRMRLLTDKTPDKKTMIMSLSRAVSRSRVILIVGGLFGENGIIKLAAGAIGKSVSLADNETYGISGNEKIEIINGSIPLVTTEGYFGGCIIESGPQTLILLSENKNIRKSVMKNLIHPYLEELSTTEIHEKTITNDENDSEPATEAEESSNIEEQNNVEAEDNKDIVEEFDISVDEIDISAQENDENTEKDDIIIDEIITSNEETDAETDITPDTGLLKEEPIFQFELEENDDEDDNIELGLDSSDTENEEADNLGLILDSEEDSESEDNSEELKDILLTDDEMGETESDKENADTIEEPFEDSELLFDTETISIKEFIIRNEEYYNEKDSVEDLITDDGEDDFVFRRKSRLNTLMIIISIILLILIVVLCFCIFYVPSKEGTSVSIYFNEIFDTLFG